MPPLKPQQVETPIVLASSVNSKSSEHTEAFKIIKAVAENLSAKLGRQEELRKYTIWQEYPIAARDEGLTLRELFNMSDWSCDEVNKLACLNAGESISVDGSITVERTK